MAGDMWVKKRGEGASRTVWKRRGANWIFAQVYKDRTQMADHLEELPWVKSGYLLTSLPCHLPLTAPGNDLSAEDRGGAEEHGNACGRQLVYVPCRSSARRLSKVESTGTQHLYCLLERADRGSHKRSRMRTERETATRAWASTLAALESAFGHLK